MPTPAATAKPAAKVLDLRTLPELRAHVTARAENIDAEARTVELAFSSEYPVDRYYGREILDHGGSAVDLSRMNNGAAFLVEHDRADQVGVIERAWVADKVGRAVVRFGRSTRAEEIFQDVQDGIRRLVSVGYRINDYVLDSSTEGIDTYRATSWTPYEISTVSIPADPTVGVGRAAGEPPIHVLNPKEPQRMDETLTPAANAAAAATVPAAEVRVIETRGQAAERERITQILAIGQRHNMGAAATKAIAEGTALDAFRATVLEGLKTDGTLKPAESPEIGLSEKEKRSYSLCKLIDAVANPHDREAQKRAAFEIEASTAARKKRPVDDADPVRLARDGGFAVPMDITHSSLALELSAAREAMALMQRLGAMGGQQRDLTAGSTTGGGNTVATDLLAGSFIEMLRARMMVRAMGATVLDGLNGNLAIPSQTGAASTFWVGENTAVTESQQTFGQVTMTPKTIGTFTDYSRRLLLQSSISIEAFVRADLAMQVAQGMDIAALTGSGSSNQPLGIMNTPGIGAEVGGTNGAAPTWDNVVNLESAVANVNADVGALGYLTNSKVRGKLKRTQKFSGTNGQAIWEGGDTINGYSAGVSNNVPSTLTKGSAAGVCSAMLFGNWADLLIGLWGGLDIVLDPFTGATAGTKRVVVLQDCDIAARRAASFAAILDLLTT